MTMVNIIKILMIAIFEMLPTSPFPAMFDSAIADATFLETLNWFLPFDICAGMMLTWLDCILVYYGFVLIKKIVIDILIDKILSAGTGLIGSLSNITGSF